MADRPADELTNRLTAQAGEGNARAALALCRLMIAEDPDAEARRILAECREDWDRMRPLMSGVADWYTGMVADGVDDAEHWANWEM